MCGNTYNYEREEAARRHEREERERIEAERREQEARDRAVEDTQKELNRIADEADEMLSRMPVGALSRV